MRSGSTWRCSRSIPIWYGRDRDLAAQIVKINNEKMAELCAAHPDRFAGFASLTLQAPELAVAELEKAMKNQGLKGAAIGGNVAGVDFSDAKFHPVWAKAEELGAVLFIHPGGTPQLNQRFAGNGWLGNTIGNPLDTTIALSKLIFEGTLDRFPGLKLLAAHGGGFLPSYADRSDHSCTVSPAGCNPAITLKKKPTEYLKQMWFDSLIFTPEAIRHLQAQVGASQIVLGSDYPYPWALKPVDHIFACEFAERRGEDRGAGRDGREAAEHSGVKERPGEGILPAPHLFLFFENRKEGGFGEEYLSSPTLLHFLSRSAICTAFSAAPFSSWSPQRKKSRPQSPKTGLARMRPASTSSWPVAVIGMG